MKSFCKSNLTVILSVFLFVFCSINTFAAVELAAIEISGGEDHTLVLASNNQVTACGDNYYDQLGLGDGSGDKDRLFRVHGPNDIGFLGDILDIDAGWKHSLALGIDGMVWAWGDDGAGQLGNGTSSGDSSYPVRVLSGEQDPSHDDTLLKNIIAVSAGRSGTHSLAVDVNHFCYAWGDNYRGQLGNNNRPTDSQTPVYVHDGDMNTPSGYLEDIIAVSAGEEHSMALDTNGFVWCWGDNEYLYSGKGKLGIADEVYDYNTTPQKVHGVNDVNFLENIVAISAGWDHCMALGIDLFDANTCSKVYCWGNNAGTSYGGNVGGRLGNGQITGSNSVPVIVLSGQQDPNNPDSYLKNILAISAGESHSMALDITGHVYAWGSNHNNTYPYECGQLGTGDYNDYNTPVKVVAPDRDGDGQPDDLDDDPNTIDYLGDDVPIVKISAGYWHCLAIDQQGNLYTWGKGTDGRLGLGNTYHYNIPKPVDYIAPRVRNLTKELEYYEIQAAIDAADTNDVIEADPGTYYEHVRFEDKALTLQSIAPHDWGIVAATIIDGEGSGYVVTFPDADSSGSTIKGFNITNGDRGIRCISSEVTVTNCIIQENPFRGICTESCSPIITHNIIRNNSAAIFMSNSNPSVQPKIINNWMYNNTSGISLSSQDSQAIIRNNTIVNNNYYGISSGAVNIPIVSNCIVWDNNLGSFSGISSVNYCCFNPGSGVSGTGNITDNPLLVDVDANNLHISPGSPCIDHITNSYPDEVDIDGEPRTESINTDIGADELYWSLADFDDSNNVDFIDYAILANTWNKSAGQDGYNEGCDLEDNNSIDYGDLALFCDEWLWQAAWSQTEEEMMMFGCGFTPPGMEKSSAVMLPLPSIHLVPKSIAPFELTSEEEQELFEELTDWLDEIWESGELKESMTETEYLEFRKALLESVE